MSTPLPLPPTPDPPLVTCKGPGGHHPVRADQLDPRYVQVCRACADSLARWGCD